MYPNSTNTPLLDRKILMEKLTQGSELAKELKFILDKLLSVDEYSVANDLINKILISFMGSISMVNRSLEVDIPVGTPVGFPKSDSRDNSNTSVLMDRRDCHKKRKRSHTSTKIIPNLIDDGHAWRKYGQKVILNAKHPRNYYRCTHKFDQGCQATKQVQKTDGEPRMYKITYHGAHTCQNAPLKTPEFFSDTTHFNDSQFLFNFNSSEKSHDNSTFQNFSFIGHDYNPMIDHMSPDLSAIESSAPISVFSPASDRGDVINYFSATSDLMESFHGFSENLDLEFDHCYT